MLHLFEKYFHLHLVSRQGDQVQELAKRHKNTTPITMDIERSQEGVEGLVKAHDVVIRFVSIM